MQVCIDDAFLVTAAWSFRVCMCLPVCYTRAISHLAYIHAVLHFEHIYLMHVYIYIYIPKHTLDLYSTRIRTHTILDFATLSGFTQALFKNVIFTLIPFLVSSANSITKRRSAGPEIMVGSRIMAVMCVVHACMYVV